MPKRVLHDKYFKQAKREGYLARSAYKLIEIDDKRRVIPRAGKVLDLGCAPGSWLQVLAERTGEKGEVVGVDLKRVTEPMPGRVRTLVGDFTTMDPTLLMGDDGKLFDAVFSDMAPDTSGHGDDFLSARLCQSVVDRLPSLLRRGGASVMKVFEGGGTPELIKRCKGCFVEAKPYKPDATREVSREIYLVCKKYRPPQTPNRASSGTGSPPPPIEGWSR
ncbi:MAG: RlmE family RNA methyltransferase [Phycisphaerales bacterium]|nr:RlmE family RNA methyltransferase [Planctomycetota bacterium]MCH8509173.1 RlmE family RNA methyltransferase [Phycisphaerales bacterium]